MSKGPSASVANATRIALPSSTPRRSVLSPTRVSPRQKQQRKNIHRSGAENEQNRASDVAASVGKKRARSPQSASASGSSKRAKQKAKQEDGPTSPSTPVRGDPLRPSLLLYSLTSVASSLSPSAITQESVSTQQMAGTGVPRSHTHTDAASVTRRPSPVKRLFPSRARRKQPQPTRLSSVTATPVVEWFTSVRYHQNALALEMPQLAPHPHAPLGASSELMRRWRCEHFCSEIDALFFDDLEFENYLYSFLAVSPETSLTHRQWVEVRKMCGVPRRFSPLFVASERAKLKCFRRNATRLRQDLAVEVPEDPSVCPDLELLENVPAVVPAGTPVLFIKDGAPWTGTVISAACENDELSFCIEAPNRERIQVLERDMLPLARIPEHAARSEPLDTLAFVATESSKAMPSLRAVTHVNALLRAKDVLLSGIAAGDSEERVAALKGRMDEIDAELGPWMAQLGEMNNEEEVRPPHPFLRFFPIAEQLVSFALGLHRNATENRDLVGVHLEGVDIAPYLDVAQPENALAQKLMAACIALVLHIQAFALDVEPLSAPQMERVVEIATTVIEQSIPKNSDAVALEASVRMTKLSACLKGFLCVAVLMMEQQHSSADVRAECTPHHEHDTNTGAVEATVDIDSRVE